MAVVTGVRIGTDLALEDLLRDHEAVLLTVNGWASWCAYLGWQARLGGRDDTHLRDLLAVRLAGFDWLPASDPGALRAEDFLSLL